MSYRIVSYPTVHADYVTNNRNTSNLHTCTCCTDYGKFVETPLKVDNDSLMQHFLLVSESTGTTPSPKYSDRKRGQLWPTTFSDLGFRLFALRKIVSNTSLYILHFPHSC